MNLTISGTLSTCLDHIASHFDLDASLLHQYARETPYPERVPARVFPKATGTPAERRIWYALVRYTKPTLAVEVGVNWGVTATQITSALKANGHGVLHAVEIRKKIEANLDPGILIPADTRNHLKLVTGTDGAEYLKLLQGVDFLSEDANHTYESAHAIYQSALGVMNPGSFCISHDAFWAKDVVKSQCDLGLHPVVYVPDGTRYGVSICQIPQ